MGVPAGRSAMVVVLLLSCGGADPAGAPTPPPCQDDELGNTSQSRSREVTGNEQFPTLALCPGTEDWFRLDARKAAGFGASACKQTSAIGIDFAAYREEFGQLYRYTNCGVSDAKTACIGTCQMESPGIYYFRVSAEQEVRYSFQVSYQPSPGNVTQGPPSFDIAPVLQPGMPLQLMVCAPFAKFYQLQIGEPSTVVIESLMDYGGYHLDFTLTDEDMEHVSYWPQGAGRTRQQLPLAPGKFMLKIRSALSGCRWFTLTHSRVPR